MLIFLPVIEKAIINMERFTKLLSNYIHEVICLFNQMRILISNFLIDIPLRAVMQMPKKLFHSIFCLFSKKPHRPTPMNIFSYSIISQFIHGPQKCKRAVVVKEIENKLAVSHEYRST